MMESKTSPGIRTVPIAIFLAVAGLFAVALRSGDPSRIPSVLVNKPAPASSFEAIGGLLNGNQPVPGFSTAELAKGRVSLVNFWASWCAECVSEHPLIAGLATATGVDVYGVAYKDTAAAARQFLGRYGNPFKAVGADTTGRQAIDWGVYGMPETFVVDGRGHIIYKHIGAMSEESIAAKIMPAIQSARGANSATAGD